MLRVSFKGLKKFADTLKPKNPEEDINVEAEIDERRMCSASNSSTSERLKTSRGLSPSFI
jgi:hypothetical protein